MRSNPMDAEKRKALEAAGWKFYDDAADWLELTEEERRLVEERLAEGPRTPNAETQQVLRDADAGTNLTEFADTDDLFRKLGIRKD